MKSNVHLCYMLWGIFLVTRIFKQLNLFLNVLKHVCLVILRLIQTKIFNLQVTHRQTYYMVSYVNFVIFVCVYQRDYLVIACTIIKIRSLVRSF